APVTDRRKIELDAIGPGQDKVEAFATQHRFDYVVGFDREQWRTLRELEQLLPDVSRVEPVADVALLGEAGQREHAHGPALSSKRLAGLAHVGAAGLFVVG